MVRNSIMDRHLHLHRTGICLFFVFCCHQSRATLLQPS